MFGGAPEAHEVLSKMPRIDFLPLPQPSAPSHFRSRLATMRELSQFRTIGKVGGQNLDGEIVSIKIGGTFSHPSYGLDLGT
jgi:hypothetical protein